MNEQAKVDTANAAPILTKLDPASPALKVVDGGIVIKAGTSFNGTDFVDDTPVAPPSDGYVAGTDYAITVVGPEAAAFKADAIPSASSHLGGFHFAPGGNATGREGGDTAPAINPFSLWDRNFRPACPDPRGMALIEGLHGERFWCDIYLAAQDHANGTSRFGVEIADGYSLPNDPATGKPFKRFDYEAAAALLKHHGKGLLSVFEFFAAAFGVTEKTSCGEDPETTKLDAPRTSKFGIIQATGNLYVWGHDGDPDTPRPSVFGGGWWDGGGAGSRRAYVACYWPDVSDDLLGARGRSDHLQLG